MECHPEEYDHREDEDEGDDAVPGLLRGELLVARSALGGLLGVDVGVLEPAAAAEIDGYRDDKRDARHGEAEVVGGRKVIDVVLAEGSEVHRSNLLTRHRGLERLKQRRVGERPAEILVGEGRNVGLVDEAGALEVAVGQRSSCRGGEHRADVDGHIEKAEGAVALGGVLRVVVEIAHEDLQVALEQAGAESNQQEGAYHQRQGKPAACEDVGRHGKAQVACEHNADACHDAFAETYLVGEPSAHDGHKVDGREEDRVELARRGSGEAEFCLQEQQEDGQHRVVAEAFAGIGQSEGKQPFRLSFKHILILYSGIL